MTSKLELNLPLPPLSECIATANATANAGDGRLALLRMLRACGVALPHRQRMVNALLRALREGEVQMVEETITRTHAPGMLDVLDQDALSLLTAHVVENAGLVETPGWKCCAARLAATCSTLHTIIQPMILLKLKLRHRRTHCGSVPMLGYWPSQSRQRDAFWHNAAACTTLDLRDHSLAMLPPLAPSEFDTLARLLATSPSLRELETLRLSQRGRPHISIGSGRGRSEKAFVAVEAFAAPLMAHSLPRLSMLDLDGARMGASGAAALGDAFRRGCLCHLEQLDVCQNELDAAALGMLLAPLLDGGASLPSLAALRLCFNPLRTEGEPPKSAHSSTAVLSMALLKGGLPRLATVALEHTGGVELQEEARERLAAAASREPTRPAKPIRAHEGELAAFTPSLLMDWRVLYDDAAVA